MNKQKLLFLTFMQNNREGQWGMGQEPPAPSLPGRGSHEKQMVTIPDPSGYVPPGHRACLLLYRRLAPMPSSLGVGLECCAGVRVL